MRKKYQLVVNSGTVYVYLNGELTTHRFQSTNPDKIRAFLLGAKLPPSEIDQKISELAEGNATEFEAD